MLYIQEMNEGMKVSGIYLVKSKTAATAKNGKEYNNVVLMDKTGVIDGKIWEPDSAAIDDFDALDYIDVVGSVSRYNGALQISLTRVRKAREDEYNTADYLPQSPFDIDEMYNALLKFIERVENPYLHALLQHFFVEDTDFVKKIQVVLSGKDDPSRFCRRAFAAHRLCDEHLQFLLSAVSGPE